MLLIVLMQSIPSLRAFSCTNKLPRVFRSDCNAAHHSRACNSFRNCKLGCDGCLRWAAVRHASSVWCRRNLPMQQSGRSRASDWLESSPKSHDLQEARLVAGMCLRQNAIPSPNCTTARHYLRVHRWIRTRARIQFEASKRTMPWYISSYIVEDGRRELSTAIRRYTGLGAFFIWTMVTACSSVSAPRICGGQTSAKMLTLMSIQTESRI